MAVTAKRKKGSGKRTRGADYTPEERLLRRAKQAGRALVRGPVTEANWMRIIHAFKDADSLQRFMSDFERLEPPFDVKAFYEAANAAEKALAEAIVKALDDAKLLEIPESVPVVDLELVEVSIEPREKKLTEDWTVDPTVSIEEV